MSKEGLEWVKFVAATKKIYIRHAENEGEKCIYTNQKGGGKKIRYRFDGYCKKSRTVFITDV